MALVRVIGGGGMTTGLTFVFCLCIMISASMGDRGLEEMLDLTEEKIQDLHREVESQLRSLKAVTCSCTGSACKCCGRIKIGPFDKEACVSMKYSQGSFTTTITFGSSTVFTRQFPLKDLGPFCFSYIGIKFCLELSNVKEKTKDSAQACLAISAKFLLAKINVPLGCFGTTKRSQVKLMKINGLRYHLADPFPGDDDKWEMVMVKEPLIE